MNKIVVLGANSFSGQDFVDLLLDDPKYQVIGVSRSQERSGLFLKYRLRKDLSQYRYYAMDMNRDMGPLHAMLDEEKPDAIVNIDDRHFTMLSRTDSFPFPSTTASM